MIRRILVSIVLSLVFTSAAVAWSRLRSLKQTWGVAPGEGTRELPGDDVIAQPTISETRGISIAATPAAIWPWLVQMGFGRGGWYSYDRIEMLGSSAWRIMPEHQSLAVGDFVPTHPGGGFRVEAIEPERSLVLYLDTELVASQVAAAKPAAGGVTPGLQMAGAVGGASMPQFRASWAFVLEPEDAGHTRLIERFRVWSPTAAGGQKVMQPLFGYGVFVMTRKQMLGIKERVEASPAPAAPVATGPSAQTGASVPADSSAPSGAHEPVPVHIETEADVSPAAG